MKKIMNKFNLIFLILFILCIFSVVAQDLVMPEKTTTVSKIPALLKVILLVLVPILFFVVSIILLKGKLKEKLWLKWGIILEILLAGQAISASMCGITLKCVGEFCGIECIIPAFPQFFISFVLRIHWIYSFLISLLIYFGIGTIIGLIIEKIKKK